MTTSASTPRLRITLLWFLGLVGLTAVTRTPSLPGPVILLLDSAGFALVVTACLGRIWCSVFIAGRKDTELVTTGPYALCRHPLYALSMLGSAGLGLASHSLVLTAATLLIQGTLIANAVVAEERYLTARYDQRYALYRSNTPTFWPVRWKQSLPELTPVRPMILWKAFVDAGSFFVLLWLVIAARRFSDAGVLAAPVILP